MKLNNYYLKSVVVNNDRLYWRKEIRDIKRVKSKWMVLDYTGWAKNDNKIQLNSTLMEQYENK